MDGKKLAKAIRDGDVLAFEIFFRAEYCNVVSFLFRYMRSYAMAQDTAQESFIQLWKTKERIDPDGNLRGYVFTIARNNAINRMSLAANRKKMDLESRQVRLYMEALSDHSVTHHIENLDMASLVNKVYDELPDNILQSFVMNREYGMTYSQIAEKRGISVKSVEYHIRTALQLFRKRLKDYLVVTAAVLISLFG